MEFKDIQSTWKSFSSSTQPSPSAIGEMLKASKHPVLRKLRLQIGIELVGWTAFILLAYTLFDGDKKPIGVNLFTLCTILLSIFHHLMGYRLSKKPIAGTNIKLSLQHYIVQVKNFAIANVGFRILFMVGILLFFTSGIELNAAKICSILVIIAVFILQLLGLGWVWKRRVSKLETTLRSLEGS